MFAAGPVCEGDDDAQRAALRHLVEEVIKPLGRGDPLAGVTVPTRYVATEAVERGELLGKDGRRLPDYLVASDLPFVSAAVADVLAQIDTGRGRVLPVEFFEHDGQTRIGARMGLLIPGNAKDTITEVSEAVRMTRSASRRNAPDAFFFARHSHGADAVALSDAAGRAPDLWVEARLIGALFFSDRARAALDDAGLAEALDLRPVPLGRGLA
ncbi:MAG: hypothetical protein V2I65_06850 [Paracoccaceae bacterium]|jgi:hypothetical protein|nr:hypothetical protein [Paracoccaceae bacterium]